MIFIKNYYTIKEQDLYLEVFCAKTNQTHIITIDKEDFELVNSMSNQWYGRMNRNVIKVMSKYNGKTYYLSKWLYPNEKKLIYHKDGNTLNYKRSNLTTIAPKKQITPNEFILKEDYALMIVSRRNEQDLELKVDLDDIECLKKYRWYSDYHKLLGDYIFYTRDYSKKNKPKISLNRYIKKLENDNKNAILFNNGNRLDFRKDNLKLYSGQINNYFYQLDDKTIVIEVKRKGTVYQCLIDIDDFEIINNIGYTWQILETHIDTHLYVVNTIRKVIDGKRKSRTIFLHRLIMNCDNPELEVDHLNHNTLDNRKSNLEIKTVSENQRNRKGPIKGNKSGFKGVSYDYTNNDWIVNILGEYILRTKDKELAVETAKKKYEELGINYNSIK